MTRTRDAIVDDQPGITRDYLYGKGRIGEKPFLVVDTGGLESGQSQLGALIKQQVEQVVEEAQIVIFIVDRHDGLVPPDRDIAQQLRQSGSRVLVAVNKAEGEQSELAVLEFQELGLGNPVAISARRGDSVATLIELALADYAQAQPLDDQTVPRITLAGRPNVGKSTLANKLLGKYRMIVSDTPGTTRDSVAIPLQYQAQDYLLVDTAGVRKRARVALAVEKFSVIKTLQAIAAADVVLLVLDASSEIGMQDATIAGMVQKLERSMVVVVNKWDRLAALQRKKIKHQLLLKLPFLPDPEVLFISALHGANIALVMSAAKRAWECAMIDIATSSLNRTLATAITQTAPPMRHQRPVRLKFAHQAGKNPPVIVVHGNRVEKLPAAYLRYLAKFFANTYRLRGTRIRVIVRSSQNPFNKQLKSR